ncbi:MAG: HU family DNA-binding protein [Candidatus Riflebacteria bacterium]|nr:HU family DNA-binding protein [Candidatus Riflebacteria bacterium]
MRLQVHSGSCQERSGDAHLERPRPAGWAVDWAVKSGPGDEGTTGISADERAPLRPVPGRPVSRGRTTIRLSPEEDWTPTLATLIAKEVKLTNAQAVATIDAFTNAVQKTLKKGGDVTLVGFGTFKVAKRAARTGVNPQTKAKMKIPAKKVVKFVAGKALKIAV